MNLPTEQGMPESKVTEDRLKIKLFWQSEIYCPTVLKEGIEKPQMCKYHCNIFYNKIC